MAYYQLSDKTRADLYRLFEYGVLTFGLQQAENYFNGIISRFQELADYPQLLTIYIRVISIRLILWIL